MNTTFFKPKIDAGTTNGKKKPKLRINFCVNFQVYHANGVHSWSRFLSKFNSKCPSLKQTVFTLNIIFFATKTFSETNGSTKFCVSQRKEGISEKN